MWTNHIFINWPNPNDISTLPKTESTALRTTMLDTATENARVTGESHKLVTLWYNPPINRINYVRRIVT
jgi:hypothetical protein